jgi:hypothetical protein
MFDAAWPSQHPAGSGVATTFRTQVVPLGPMDSFEAARRNARDYERLPQHSEAHLNWALITMMTRRLTRKSPRTSSWTKKPTR